MKKTLSISLVFALLLAVLPCSGVIASAADLKIPSPQYIAEDFNNGLQNVTYTVKGGGQATATASGRNGTGALHYTTTANYSAVQFPVRTLPNEVYHISAWVKFDEVPNTQYMYFVFYNPCVSNESHLAWNQIRANHDTIEAGQWVELTATYTGRIEGDYNNGQTTVKEAILPDGTLEIRVGTGVPANDMTSGTYAYTLDDLYVFPEGQNQLDNTEMLPNGNMASSSAMTGTWKYSNEHWFYDYGEISWQSAGANGTTGSMKVTVKVNNGRALTKSSIDFQYGKRYRLAYYAKADDDAAVGLAPTVYLDFPNDRDAGFPDYIDNIRPVTGTTKKLTNDWQLFEYDIEYEKLITGNARPTLNLRMGTGNEKCSYSIDEISMKQAEPHDFAVAVSEYGSLDSDAGLVCHMALPQSTQGTFLYSLYNETASGDALLKRGRSDDGVLTLHGEEFPENAKLRLDVIGVDSYGNCSKVQKYYLKDAAYQDMVTLKPDQYIWNKDITKLSATVSYQNESQACQVVTYVAQYNQDNRLLTTYSKTESVSAFADKTWNVEVNADPAATKVKYFAWVAGSQTPITAMEELTKTTSGEFIYVDVNSTATTENGSFNAPYKNLSATKDYLSSRLSASSEKDFYIILKSGEYGNEDYETLEITQNDCAVNKNIIYTSLNSDRAKITGAMHLPKFQIEDASKNIYAVSVPAGTKTRQLYVNGIKATRARSPEEAIPFVNLDEGSTASNFSNQGLTSTDTSFLNYQYKDELELYFTQNWTHQFVMVDTITESNGLAHFGFTDNVENWKGVLMEHTYATTPVYVENAYELLDEPGEWYLDTHKNELYYIPREFEDINTADVVIPITEKLVTVSGTADNPAKNVTFKNIDFEYATWNMPTTNRGLVNNQNATYKRSDGAGRLMDAAVELYNAHNITFDNCDFSKLGSTALKMTGAIQHCNVIGNEFYELAGGAINLGEVSTSNENIYNPQSTKLFITDNLIANNYIHKVATEYKSAAAIGAGFPKNTVIRNNELTDGPYSGMHLGWGWQSGKAIGTKNFVVEKNYIHDFMNQRLYDGGGIYTLGETAGTQAEPNYLRGNYITDIQNIHGAIYPDEGSKGWSISDNVCDMRDYPIAYGKESTKEGARWFYVWNANISNIWVGKNYSTINQYRNNGTNVTYTKPEIYYDANWTGEAKKIVEASGIEKQYQNRFDFALQSIHMPKLYEVAAGQELSLAYNGISSKDRNVDLSDYEITAKSTNPAVATATKAKVTGHSAGTAWITFKILKRVDGEVQHYDEHTFRVVVK